MLVLTTRRECCWPTRYRPRLHVAVGRSEYRKALQVECVALMLTWHSDAAGYAMKQ